MQTLHTPYPQGNVVHLASINLPYYCIHGRPFLYSLYSLTDVVVSISDYWLLFYLYMAMGRTPNLFTDPTVSN